MLTFSGLQSGANSKMRNRLMNSPCEKTLSQAQIGRSINVGDGFNIAIQAERQNFPRLL